MSTPAWLSLIAIIFTFINFVYLLTKDRFQKVDSERKECLSVLKDCFSKILKKDYDGNIMELTSNIEALGYLTIIRLNCINVNRLALIISDYYEKSISEEAVVGEYKMLVEDIYTADIPLWEYIKCLFKNFKKNNSRDTF
ncbi:hypothetical protein [Campylobacter sp. FOBRC14]|jgi:hypothetical protein|uniref:hypothetical protein n=1 Tax=Campylobacter sp. FOBRC14 TaxID=936554 RepID=UPI00055601E2|nr:hypothetical protein [Campylobacter sp. FOBRC14]